MIHYIAIAKEMCQNGIDVPSSVVLPIIERTELLERLLSQDPLEIERALKIERLAREALAAYDNSDSDANAWIAAQAALRKALL